MIIPTGRKQNTTTLYTRVSLRYNLYSYANGTLPKEKATTTTPLTQFTSRLPEYGDYIFIAMGRRPVIATDYLHYDREVEFVIRLRPV